MPELVGVTNLAARSPFMVTGDEQGEVQFWDKNANIIEITAYPIFDDGNGNSDWGNEVMFVSRAGDGIAVGDLDFSEISFVSAASLNFRKSYTSPDPRNIGYTGPLGVGDEFWTFTSDFRGSTEVFYVTRFSARGDLLGTMPIDNYGTSPGNHGLSWVATWDNETFYLVDGQSEPSIWQWTPGSPAVFLGSIWADLQGPYPGVPFSGGGDGECRTIALHGPSELLATTYDQVFDHTINDWRTHAALVRFSLPDLTVLNRYEISDNLASIPLLSTTVIPLPSDPNNTKDYVLPFICASDGQQMWVANWVHGEIWKVSDSGEFTLWNHLLDDQLGDQLVIGLARPSVICMNVRDFVGYQVPMASFHNRLYPGPHSGVSAYAHQATDPTIKYAAPRRLQ